MIVQNIPKFRREIGTMSIGQNYLIPGMGGLFLDRNKFKRAMEVVLNPLNVTVRGFKFCCVLLWS